MILGWSMLSKVLGLDFWRPKQTRSRRDLMLGFHQIEGFVSHRWMPFFESEQFDSKQIVYMQNCKHTVN
jgi:hypothetical protein